MITPDNASLVLLETHRIYERFEKCMERARELDTPPMLIVDMAKVLDLLAHVHNQFIDLSKEE